MRILAFILCFYFAALSVVPCADGMPENPCDSNTELSTTQHDHNHSDHEDNCTPFCDCACCGTVITTPNFQPIFRVKIDITTDHHIHYTFNYSFDYCEGIWHPPSLS